MNTPTICRGALCAGWWIFRMAPRVDIGQHSEFLVKIYMFITQLSFNDRARKIFPESHIEGYMVEWS
jgi:hypothetical protein